MTLEICKNSLPWESSYWKSPDPTLTGTFSWLRTKMSTCHRRPYCKWPYPWKVERWMCQQEEGIRFPIQTSLWIVITNCNVSVQRHQIIRFLSDLEGVVNRLQYRKDEKTLMTGWPRRRTYPLNLTTLLSFELTTEMIRASDRQTSPAWRSTVNDPESERWTSRRRSPLIALGEINFITTWMKITKWVNRY